MEYGQISQVNSEIKMIDLKGKNYAMVPERVNAFRKIFPDGFIETEIVSHDGTTVLMKAKAGYYNVSGNQIILGTGYAQEVRGKGLVNGTSYIENCETSAVGRALGMIGLGINGGGICSAEELVNAITAQNQMANEKLPQTDPVKPTANVTASNVVPMSAMPEKKPEKQISEAQHFILCSIAQMKKDIQKFDFGKMRQKLIESGAVDNKKSDEMTLDDAVKMVRAFYMEYGKQSVEDATAKVSGMVDMFIAGTAK